MILDGADSVGAAWRDRWDSLVLFTPRRYDSLPGLAFPGNPDGYPTRDEVVAYLEHVRGDVCAPGRNRHSVRSLTKKGRAFELELDGHTIEADQVVIATGPFQTPRVPSFASELAPDVFQTHSPDYRAERRPRRAPCCCRRRQHRFPDRNRARRDAQRPPPIGSRQTPLPQRLPGRDLFWWLATTTSAQHARSTRTGGAAQPRHADRLKPPPAQAHGVHTQAAPDRRLRAHRQLRGRDRLAVDAVIWATGFGLDHSWIDLPCCRRNGEVVIGAASPTCRACTSSGLPWQHTRGSALLGWVKDDAAYLAEQIAAHATAVAKTTPAPPAPVMAVASESA